MTWFVKAPDGVVFQLASPQCPDAAGRHHEVEEHEDGTITVEPRPGTSRVEPSARGAKCFVGKLAEHATLTTRFRPQTEEK